MYAKKVFEHYWVLIILCKAVLTFASLIVTYIIPAADRKMLHSRIDLPFRHLRLTSCIKRLTTASTADVFLAIKKKWKEKYLRFSYQVSSDFLSHVLF